MKPLITENGDIKVLNTDLDLEEFDLTATRITANGLLTLECEEELFIELDETKAYAGFTSNIDNHNDDFDTITGQRVYSIGMNMDNNCDGIIDNYKDDNGSFSVAHRFYQGSDRSFEGGYDFDTIVGGIVGACANNNDINAVGKTLSAVNFGFYSDVYFGGSSTNGNHNVNNVLISGTLESRYHNITNGVVRNIMLWVYEDIGLGIDNNPTFMPKEGDENYVILNESVYPIVMRADNSKMIFGAGDDSEIYYDGTNLVINPKAVGSGYLEILGGVNIGTENPTEYFSVTGSTSFYNTINFTYEEVTDVFESEVKYGTVNTVDFMGMEFPFASGLYVKVSGEPTTVPPIGVMSNNYIGFTSFNQEYHGGMGVMLYGGAESTGLAIYADSYGIDMTVGLSSDFGESARTKPILMNTYLYPNQGGIGFSLYIEDDYSEYFNYDVYGIKLHGNTNGWGIFLDEFSTGIEIDLSAGAYGLKVDNGSATDYAIYSTTGRNYFGNNIEVDTGTNTKLVSEELVFDLDALVTYLKVSIPIINATAYSNMPEVVNFPYLVGFYDRIAVLDKSEAGASEIFFSTIDFTNNASIVADFTNSRFLTNWDWCPQDDDTYDLGRSGNQWKDLYLSGSIKVDGTSAVADGTYTVGIGSTQNGTITTKGGIITAIQEAI